MQTKNKSYSVILTTAFYDMNQKIYNQKKPTLCISKISVNPILHLQVMHDYIVFHCSIGYCVEWSLSDENYVKIALISH